MPQKTNLNISPYYDDFDKEDKFYKVLFKPGFPVQARELTTLQSSLQNQIENIQAAKKKENAISMGGMIEGPQLVKPPSLINNSSNIMSSSSMSQVNSVGIKTISIDPYITDYSE